MISHKLRYYPFVADLPDMPENNTVHIPLPIGDRRCFVDGTYLRSEYFQLYVMVKLQRASNLYPDKLIISILNYLRLWIATANHNLKWLKITHICLI